MMVLAPIQYVRPHPGLRESLHFGHMLCQLCVSCLPLLEPQFTFFLYFSFEEEELCARPYYSHMFLPLFFN
jgi:hypothetical protein